MKIYDVQKQNYRPRHSYSIAYKSDSKYVHRLPYNLIYNLY